MTEERFYHTEKTADEYIRMAEGYDGKEIIATLRQHLEDKSTVLELGIGPGKDLNLLAEHYQVTGSDLSPIFLEKYKANNPAADLLLLDAVTIDTNRTFDCIYSNKVLHHLTDDELEQSIKRQNELLSHRGLVCHSFWAGEGEEFFHGMRFNYHTRDHLEKLIDGNWEILELSVYEEMANEDSILMIAAKR